MGTKLLIVDAETGGLDPARHSILSLAGVVWEDGAVLDSKEIFIHEPIISADVRALEVNGIDLKWLEKNGDSPARAATKFLAFIITHFGLPKEIADKELLNADCLPPFKKIVLCGQNVGFDVGFIKRLFKQAGVPKLAEQLFSHRTLDMASIIRFLQLANFPFENGSLDDAARKLRILTPARHTALGDATLTATVLSRLIALTKTACAL